MYNKRNLADMIINDEEETSTFHSEYSIRDTYTKLYESCSPIDDHPIANVLNQYIIIRLLHRILAKRLLQAVDLNPCQKAFIPTDRWEENTFLLDYIISDAGNTHKQLSCESI